MLKIYEDARSFNSTSLVISDECNQLHTIIIAIEQIITQRPSNKEMEKGLTDFKLIIEESKERIQDKKEKWKIYCDFKDAVEFIKINLGNKGNELKEKAQKLIQEEKKHKQEIEEKLKGSLQILENIKKEYETLERAAFAEFNFYILDDVEGEYVNALKQAEMTLEELELFDKEVKIYLTSLVRKSTFYITLEEMAEARRLKSRLGEIAVSFKTFKSYDIGKKYKKDLVVSNKRTVSSQYYDILVILEERQNKITKELEKEEFAALYKELPLGKKHLEADETGLPWEIQLSDLKVLICEKESKSFAVKSHLDYFNDRFYSLFNPSIV